MEILAIGKRKIAKHSRAWEEGGDRSAALTRHLSRLTVDLTMAGDLQPVHLREQGWGIDGPVEKAGSDLTDTGDGLIPDTGARGVRYGHMKMSHHQTAILLFLRLSRLSSGTQVTVTSFKT